MRSKNSASTRAGDDYRLVCHLDSIALVAKCGEPLQRGFPVLVLGGVDLAVLELRDDVAPDERLFAVTKHFLAHEMERGCKTSGVKRIRIHDIRHSHVSLLIEMGFSALAIAERMGHEAVDITYRYAHLFPTKQDEMAAWSNMLRQDYIIAKLADAQVEVRPSVSVQKALKDSMAELAKEVHLAASYGELSESLQQRVELVMGLFLALGEPVDDSVSELLERAAPLEGPVTPVMDAESNTASIFGMGRG